MNCFLVVQLIKDSVTANDYEIKLWLWSDFECCDVRFSYHNLRVPFQFSQFSLNVAECAAYWEPPRKNSVRSINHLLLPLECGIRVWNYWGILIYPTTIFLDPFHLYVICGLVIVRKYNYFFSVFCRHEGTTVTYIGHITYVINNNDDDSTGAWTI